MAGSDSAVQDKSRGAASMKPKEIYAAIEKELEAAKASKTYKWEVPLYSDQAAEISTDGKIAVMLASNNYLGLANHPRVKAAAGNGLDNWGYGVASVRFICGTQKIHLELEQKIAKFLGVEDAILHSSCFAANEAFFTALLNNDFGSEGYKDIIYSDTLNHASIIDGIRLCRQTTKTTDLKAYKHNDLEDLRKALEENKSKGYRISIIATDGVFSMEGEYADLAKMRALADEYGALLFVDESHSTGVLGRTGRGTPELCGVHGQIDVITGTLGKALGGAAGGFIAGKKELIDFMRQKSRPYTFSNSLPASIVSASIEVFDMLERDASLVEKLRENTEYFRSKIKAAGFTIIEGVHPIVPVMVGEASTAQDMSDALLNEGVYVRGLWYPVVPKGEARLRCQISAAHSRRNLDFVIEQFTKVGKKLGVLK